MIRLDASYALNSAGDAVYGFGLLGLLCLGVMLFVAVLGGGKQSRAVIFSFGIVAAAVFLGAAAIQIVGLILKAR